MILFWVTVPFMALAVLWAVGFVALRSVREERRLRAQAMATGEAEVPEDDTTRVVVRAKPAFEHRTKHVVNEELNKGLGTDDADELRRFDSTPTADDHHVVVSVPGADAQSPSIECIVNRFTEDESIESVKVLPRRPPTDGSSTQAKPDR